MVNLMAILFVESAKEQLRRQENGTKTVLRAPFRRFFSFPQNTPLATQAIILKASLRNLPEVDEAVVVVGSTRQAFGQAHLWVRNNCW